MWAAATPSHPSCWGSSVLPRGLDCGEPACVRRGDHGSDRLGGSPRRRSTQRTVTRRLGASLNDPRRFDAIVDGYGADPAEARAWAPIHAAELWPWSNDAGPPEYLSMLTLHLW